MTNIKTTVAGLILAVLVVIQPIIEGVGYHLDAATIGKLIFAAALAALGYLSKDHSNNA